MTVVTSYSDEVPLVPEEPQSEIVEPLSSEEDPSLGFQIASGALSLLYAPVKIAYAGLEGFMGGLAYLLTAGNEDGSVLLGSQFTRNLLAQGEAFTR